VGGVLGGSAARIAGGIGIVTCAAVIALAAGGAGVFGGLGSLLGRSGTSLEIATHNTSAADIVAAPTAAERAVEPRTVTRSPAGNGRPQSPRRGSQAPSTPPGPTTPGSSTPAIPPVAPSPNPAPSLPPPGPAPSPGSGQVIATLGDALKQVTSQAPPEARPLTQPLNDAVDTLVQTCRGLPACP
jgi:hypothetical protein